MGDCLNDMDQLCENQAEPLALNDERQLIEFLTNSGDKLSEISDLDLLSSDTVNMIEHGKLYTHLLKIYVDSIGNTFRAFTSELPKHADELDRSFLEELLSWSEKLPEHKLR